MNASDENDESTDVDIPATGRSPTALRLSRPHPLIKRTLEIKIEKDPYG